MKRVFENRPSLPRYGVTWNIAVVLNHLRKLHPADNITLKELTLKVVMLLALLSGQGRQTLHALKISCMQFGSDRCVFVIDNLLKTSKPGRHLSRLEFLSYALDPSICVIKYLTEYVRRTQALRQGNGLLLSSFQKPHRLVQADTVS